MEYEVVFRVFLGLLVVLGCAVFVIFLIEFREDVTIHPIYRSRAASANPHFARVKLARSELSRFHHGVGDGRASPKKDLQRSAPKPPNAKRGKGEASV